MSLASTVTRPFRYLYKLKQEQRRTGIPGEIGGGGYGSGADPDNPMIMHYGGGGVGHRYSYNPQKRTAPVYTPVSSDIEGPPQQDTGDNAEPESNYVRLARHLRELQTTPVRDENGRLRSGASQLRPTRASSLGEAVGQKVGQFLYGAIRPKTDEKEERDKEEKRTYAQMGVEGALKKEDRESEESAARVDANRSLAEQRRRPKEAKYQKDARGRLWLPDPDDPTKVRQVTDESGKVLDAKFERPLTIPYLMSNGVDYGTAKYDEASDSYVPVSVSGAPAVQKQAQPVATDGPNKGRTPQQVEQDKQKELDRKSHEKIAATYAALQGQRNSLSQAEFSQRTKQFQATHPGFGKPALKKSEIEADQDAENRNAQRQGRQPRNLRSEAVSQGYQIDDEN